MTGRVILSDCQRAALQCLCLTGRASLEVLSENTGARQSTMQALTRLCLVECREAGARAPLYYLTSLGRELYCAPPDDDPDGSLDSSPTEGWAPTTKEVPTMSTTTAEPAAKTAAEKPSLQPLFDDLVKAVKTAVSGKTDKKAAYVRVNAKNGKTVAYVSFPTRKSVRVEIPRVGQPGYDVIKAATDADVPKVVKAAETFLEKSTAAAAAKASASA